MLRSLPATASIVMGTALLLSAPVACKSPDREAARAELASYLQRSVEWAPVEAETARVIDRILATQFVDEAEVRRQIAADAPRVRAHIDRVSSVVPRTPQLESIHRAYVENWRQLARGYDRILAGLDTADAAELAAGRQDLASWRQGIVDTARSLSRLRANLASAHEKTKARAVAQATARAS